MAECDWAILCDHGFQDLGRKSCLIGIFDRVFAPTAPTTLVKATLVARVLGDPGEKIRFKIEVAREAGSPLGGAEGDLTIPDTGTHEIFANFLNLNLPEYGLYSVNVYLNDFPTKATTFILQKLPAA
jgi:hypothetical protein